MLYYVSLSLQYEMRLKTIAYTLLGGKKREWRFQERWIGDELSIPEKNSKSDQFQRQVHTTTLIL